MEKWWQLCSIYNLTEMRYMLHREFVTKRIPRAGTESQEQSQERYGDLYGCFVNNNIVETLVDAYP